MRISKKKVGGNHCETSTQINLQFCKKIKIRKNGKKDKNAIHTKKKNSEILHTKKSK